MTKKDQKLRKEESVTNLKIALLFQRAYLKEMLVRVIIELTTLALSASCSPTELKDRDC